MMKRLYAWLNCFVFSHLHKRIVWIPARYFRPVDCDDPVVGAPYFIIGEGPSFVTYTWMFYTAHMWTEASDIENILVASQTPAALTQVEKHRVHLAIVVNRFGKSKRGLLVSAYAAANGKHLGGFDLKRTTERGRSCLFFLSAQQAK